MLQYNTFSKNLVGLFYVLLNHTYRVVWFVGLPFRHGGGRRGQDFFDILFKCL